MRPTSSILDPRSAAKQRATSTTYAGSFRFPRNGTGVRKGQSVSISSLSSGTCAAIARKSSAFLKVTMPEKEIEKPNSMACCASAKLPLKQCMMPEGSARPPRFQCVDSFCFRLARVNDHGQTRVPGQFKLPPKHFHLYIARRVVVVKVKPDFTPGNHARALLDETRDSFFRFIVKQTSVVGCVPSAA